MLDSGLVEFAATSALSRYFAAKRRAKDPNFRSAFCFRPVGTEQETYRQTDLAWVNFETNMA